MDYLTVLILTIAGGLILGTWTSFFDSKRNEHPIFTIKENYGYSFVTFFAIFNFLYLIMWIFFK